MILNDAKELATKLRIAVKQVHEFSKQLKDLEYTVLFLNKNGEVGNEYSEEFSNIQIWKIERKEV